jgi:hypothetical protein
MYILNSRNKKKKRKKGLKKRGERNPIQAKAKPGSNQIDPRLNWTGLVNASLVGKSN